MIDMTGKVVLVTGGTLGIGKAAALAYARAGAHTVVTHRWGSADENELRQTFIDSGAKAPLIVQADVANDEDTDNLLNIVADTHTKIDVYISNVAFALRTPALSDWSKRGLHQSIDYSAWPLWSYTDKIHKKFGCYPKTIIGLSSDGPDSFFMNYDFVAATKSVLESMCRYMNFRLFEHGSRVNIVRSRLVKTESFDATFGQEFHDFLNEMGGFDDCYTTPEELANVMLALGSGLLDAIGGQVIMVDKGFRFFDNLMGIAERRKQKSGK